MATRCLHERVHREYVLGMQDDLVCEDCGGSWATQKQLEEDRLEARQKQESRTVSQITKPD